MEWSGEGWGDGLGGQCFRGKTEDEFAPLALMVKTRWAWGTQIQGLPGANVVFVSCFFISLGPWPRVCAHLS